jgi:hypothetical protein
MTDFVPGVPQPGEYHSAFAGYIAQAQSFSAPVQELARQSAELLQLLRPLGAAQRGHRYAPGKWSIQEMLGHIIDAERIFAYRALRIARSDHTPLAGFEENDYAVTAQSEMCDWASMLEEFEHVRRSSVLLYQHVPEPAWMNLGIVNQAPVSVRALAYIMLGHVAHHAGILRERYLNP